jgi:hypothetical protein
MASLAKLILLATLLTGTQVVAQENKKTDEDKPADPDTGESTVEEKTLSWSPPLSRPSTTSKLLRFGPGLRRLHLFQCRIRGIHAGLLHPIDGFGGRVAEFGL